MGTVNGDPWDFCMRSCCVVLPGGCQSPWGFCGLPGNPQRGLDGSWWFLSAATYWLTREQIIWAVDETQTRCPHTSNSSSSCNSLFKRGGDGKAGVTPPAGCNKHDTHTTTCPHTTWHYFYYFYHFSEERGASSAWDLAITALSRAVPDIRDSYAWHSMSFRMTTLPLCLQSCRHHYVSDF